MPMAFWRAKAQRRLAMPCVWTWCITMGEEQRYFATAVKSLSWRAWSREKDHTVMDSSWSLKWEMFWITLLPMTLSTFRRGVKFAVAMLHTMFTSSTGLRGGARGGARPGASSWPSPCWMRLINVSTRLASTSWLCCCEVARAQASVEMLAVVNEVRSCSSLSRTWAKTGAWTHPVLAKPHMRLVSSRELNLSMCKTDSSAIICIAAWMSKSEICIVAKAQAKVERHLGRTRALPLAWRSSSVAIFP
mmetsp:Transcript_45194/g.133810  ORF Transcript_45194/g.133810 Transcript_45194/m.133810 type:complete len:247 (+) Transcript_45194:2205-2945(+)